MKKKIIFMIINMNVGGTEKALLNLISEIPKDKYEITILMLKKEGGFLDSIPNEVHVQYLKGYNNIKDILNKPPRTVSLNFIKKGKIIRAFNIFFLHLISKIMKERSLFFKYVLAKYTIINDNYDIAIAYAGPMDFISYFVVNKINAKKKIQWIHFDVTKIGFNQKFAAKIYKKFDKIYVVSEEGRDRLVKLLPSQHGKIEKFVNLISAKNVKKMADEGVGFEDNFNGIRILTVGRLSTEKGQDLIISVLSKLKQNGFNVRWYCIGEGNARKDYEKQIRDSGLEKDFILLGSIPNPYPFMKQCNIYVQPSRHEGYCITLAEARVLGKPIVTTNFVGAREQIDDKNNGLIVKFDKDEMYNAVHKLIINKNLRIQFTNALKEQNFCSQTDISECL